MGGGGRVKIKLFQNMVMLHILKRIKNAVGQNSTFSEHGHVAYLKENQECSSMPHGSKYFAHRHTPFPTTLWKRIKNAATW